MYRVTKKPYTGNTVWDGERDCALCTFKNGVIETDNERVVEKLKEMGYEGTEIEVN